MWDGKIYFVCCEKQTQVEIIPFDYCHFYHVPYTTRVKMEPHFLGSVNSYIKDLLYKRLTYKNQSQNSVKIVFVKAS